MSKKIVEAIRAKQQQHIEQHTPAKDAPVYTDEELSDIESFERAIDEAILSSRDQSRNVETDGFHPSSLGIATSKCGRRNVYLLRGVEKKSTFPARVIRIFDTGHAVHERLQTLFESMDVDMQTELPINLEIPPIAGHADGALTWRGKRKLIEIKSCSDDVYMNRLKWKKPKDEHFAQANVYAYILDIDTVWIIYENKNNQSIKIFEKPTDREAAKKIIDTWHAQYLCFVDGELPVRPYKPGHSVCAGCDLREHCYSDPEIGVDLKPYKETVSGLE